MTLADFKTQFDFPGSVVLLEGKRSVNQDEDRLFTLGKLLVEKTEHILFRSGNADGADFHFSRGVASVNRSRLQIVVPYGGHRAKEKLSENIISLEDLDLSREGELIDQSKSHKPTHNLIDKFLDKGQNHVTIKAAYILRDTLKVIGTQTIPVAAFGIFYDDLSKPMTGGTGHTMNTCLRKNIPIIDQRVWFGWF